LHDEKRQREGESGILRERCPKRVLSRSLIYMQSVRIRYYEIIRFRGEQVCIKSEWLEQGRGASAIVDTLETS